MLVCCLSLTNSTTGRQMTSGFTQLNRYCFFGALWTSLLLKLLNDTGRDLQAGLQEGCKPAMQLGLGLF